jgi:diguanylate cyclase (GGDEF)-like protein
MPSDGQVGPGSGPKAEVDEQRQVREKLFGEFLLRDGLRKGRSLIPQSLLGSVGGLLLFALHDRQTLPSAWPRLLVARLLLTLVGTLLAYGFRMGQLDRPLLVELFSSLSALFYAWGASRIGDPAARASWSATAALLLLLWPALTLPGGVTLQLLRIGGFALLLPLAGLLPGAQSGMPFASSGGLLLLFAAVASVPLAAWRSRTLVEEARVRFDLQQKARELEGQRSLIEYQAMHDALTGALSRHAGLQALKQAMGLSRRQQRPLSVVYVDVNDLKRVNDERGHAVGDEIIRTAAVLVHQSIRSSDLLCRLGGGEFLVVLHDCSEADGRRVVEKWQAALAAFNDDPSRPFVVSTSSGIVEWDADSEVDGDALIARASAAMSDAKRTARQSARFR